MRARYRSPHIWVTAALIVSLAGAAVPIRAEQPFASKTDELVLRVNRVRAQSGWIVVEVISAISADPQGPVDWWLNDSPEVHGKVLLNPRWREIGVGYAEGGQYGHYWTALFGCRPGVLPSVTLDGVAYTHTEQCGDPNVAAVMATPTSVPTPTAVLTVTPAPTVTSLPIATPRLTIAKSEAVTAGRVVNVQWQGIESPPRK